MKRIAVLGAYGSVGRHALKYLYNTKKYELYACGRDPDKVRNDTFFTDMHGVKWIKLDVSDSEALEESIQDKDAVLNTVSYSGNCSENILKICTRMKKAYVDAGIPENAAGFTGRKDISVIYGAGALPGLSSILGIYCAEGFSSVTCFRHITSFSGAFSYGAAYDYLKGICERSVNKSYEKNEFLKDVTLPVLGGTDLMQYSDNETEYVLKKTDCEDGKHYVSFGNSSLIPVIKRTALRFNDDPEGAVSELVTFSRMYNDRSDEHTAFIIEVKGRNDSEDIYRTLVLKFDSSSSLTGLAAGVCTGIAADAEGPFGVYSLSEFPECRLYANALPVITEAIRNSEHKVLFEIYGEGIDMIINQNEGEI